jgi:hypothetical protein
MIFDKDEYFPDHHAAQVRKEALEKLGAKVDLTARLRVGVVIYCLRPVWPKPMEGQDDASELDGSAPCISVPANGILTGDSAGASSNTDGRHRKPRKNT